MPAQPVSQTLPYIFVSPHTYLCSSSARVLSVSSSIFRHSAFHLAFHLAFSCSSCARLHRTPTKRARLLLLRVCSLLLRDITFRSISELFVQVLSESGCIFSRVPLSRIICARSFIRPSIHFLRTSLVCCVVRLINLLTYPFHCAYV
jgi:hypothetical protein